MSFPTFRSFWPVDAAKWLPTPWQPRWKAIVDARTGALTGIQSQDATAPDGIWAPVPLTAAQIASPSARILADLNATYQLNASPFTRYRSDGVSLLSLDDTGGDVIPPGENLVMFSPLVITEANSPFVVRGGVRVIE